MTHNKAGLELVLVLTGVTGSVALLNFALALERHIQSACSGAVALPSAAEDPEAQSFFAAPRNQTVLTSSLARSAMATRPNVLLAHHRFKRS